jgi:hypothetical protein
MAESVRRLPQGEEQSITAGAAENQRRNARENQKGHGASTLLTARDNNDNGVLKTYISVSTSC